MTIPRIPGFADDLVPAIQQLGQAIPRILNPNLDIQLQLRAALAKDPTLRQKLIDMGPEAVGQIYGKQATEAGLGFGQKSAEQQQEELLRGAFAENANNPLFKEQLIAAKTGTKTKKENILEDQAVAKGAAGVITAESEAKVAKATEDNKIKEFNVLSVEHVRQIDEMQKAVAKYPDLAKVNINQVVSDLASGRAPNTELLMRLGQVQGVGDAIRQAVDSRQQQAQIAAQFSLQRLREQSREMKSQVAGILNQAVDNSRQAINNADVRINQFKGEAKSAQLLLDTYLKKGVTLEQIIAAPAGKYDALVRNGAWATQQYGKALKDRTVAETEYNTNNDRWQGVVQNLIGVEKVNPGSISPPELKPYIDAWAANTDSTERTKMWTSIQTRSPEVAEKLAPFLGIQFKKNDKKEGPLTLAPVVVDKPENPKPKTSSSYYNTGEASGLKPTGRAIKKSGKNIKEFLEGRRK